MLADGGLRTKDVDTTLGPLKRPYNASLGASAIKNSRSQFPCPAGGLLSPMRNSEGSDPPEEELSGGLIATDDRGHGSGRL